MSLMTVKLYDDNNMNTCILDVKALSKCSTFTTTKSSLFFTETVRFTAVHVAGNPVFHAVKPTVTLFLKCIKNARIGKTLTHV